MVIVATESNDIYALSASTGQLIWHQHPATPVPSTSLPCGNITPTVGITSTPAIDPANGELFVVADTWDGAHAHHVLYAYRASDGTPLFATGVDPSGSIPENQLQRAALNLAGGRVMIGFGGNNGDCATYWGWLVAASETGSGVAATWKAPVSNGAAIWAAGGPVVDGSGFVYAATGNTTTTPPSYDHSETIEKFNAQLTEQDYFAPASWQSDDTKDLDLGSASPQLVDGGMIFQAGKNGNGYLVSTSAMGHIGGQLFTAPVCASYGADSYLNGRIFVACSDGIRALALDPLSRRFSILWHGPADANGPPIVAGGLVWVTAYYTGKLYGLAPSDGTTLVTQVTPAMEHFTTPTAANGRLFLATGSTVEAYTIGTGPPTATSPGTPGPLPLATGTAYGAPITRRASSALGVCGRMSLPVHHPPGTRIVRAALFIGSARVPAAEARGHDVRRVHFVTGTRSFVARLLERTSSHHRVTYRVAIRDCKRVSGH
jgi:outer membrane protein assembly factor BamB